MNKTLKHLLGVLFLSLALLASQIPGTTTTAASAISTDFLIRSGTLVQYTGTASTVSVPATVKKIAEGAFSDNAQIVSLTIPATVKEIGDAAFSDCTNLTDVTIQGNGLQDLGAGVFAGCDQLSNVSFADGASFFCKDGVIYGSNGTRLIEVLPDSGITKLVMGSEITKIEEFAAWGVSTLRTVSVSENVNRIPAYAFASCANLNSVSLPGNLSYIDLKAFADDANLINITVPVMTKVHETAFDGCSSLGTVSAIDQLEYEDTDGNATVVSPENVDVGGVSGNDPEGGKTPDGEGPSDETQTGEASEDANSDGNDQGSCDDASSADSGSYSVTIAAQGQSLATSKIVGGRAVLFVNNSEQTVYSGSATIAEDPSQNRVQDPSSGNGTDTAGTGDGTATDPVNPAQSVSGNDQTIASNTLSVDGGVVANADLMQTISNALTNSDEKGVSIPKYTIYNHQIADQAFYYDENLTSYAITDGITEIGSFSFARSALEQIILPEGVTSIDYAAFYHCDSLGEVSIPSTVTYIGPYAFDHTLWLDSFYATSGDSDYLVVGDGVLLAYRGSDSIAQIPEGVKHIASGAFDSHQGLTSAVMPSTLLTIEEEAFRGCTNLTNVTLNEGLTSIADRAFADSNVSKVILPSTLSEIGLRSFGGNEHCAALFLGDSLPQVTYEASSQRLSNSSYRDYALGDFGIMLISEEASKELTDTVADESCLGFAGYVLTYEDAGGGTAEPFTLIHNGLSRSLPSDVLFLDRSFTVYQGSVDAVDSCLMESETLPAEEAELLTESTAEEEIPTAGTIQISNLSDALGIEQEIAASIEGLDESYLLRIHDSDYATSLIQTAYRSSYGTDLPTESVVTDMTLLDATGNVPITKLGKRGIAITCEVPDALTVNGSLHILTTDADGQLEELDYTSEIPEDGGNVRITFTTNHFSPICFYNYVEGEVAGAARVIGGKLIFTNGSAALDDTPDTGDLIHPKWFLVVGFFFAGIACFLIPARKKKVGA